MPEVDTIALCVRIGFTEIIFISKYIWRLSNAQFVIYHWGYEPQWPDIASSKDVHVGGQDGDVMVPAESITNAHETTGELRSWPAQLHSVIKNFKDGGCTNTSMKVKPVNTIYLKRGNPQGGRG